jgi:hypothetical protein
MGNNTSSESTPIHNTNNKGSTTSTMVLEAQDHINIYKGTQTPCPICKKVNCGLK